MRTRVWRRVRDQVDRTNAGIHDDLDLTIRLRRADGVRYDPQLRMPVSARPVQTVSGLSRRIWRVATTFATSWPEGSRWHRRAEIRGAMDAGAPAIGDGPWLPGDEDLAPRFGS